MGYDPAPQRGPESVDETVIAAVLFLVALGFFAAEVATNYHPGKLVGLLFVLTWPVLVLWHEAGHALAARMVGWRVERTVVGFGKPVYQGTFLGAPLELRLYPVMGFVQSRPENVRYSPLADAFIYFAGPGVELLLFAVLAFGFGPDRYFAATDDPLLLIGQALGIAAVAGAVLNLIPGVGSVDGQTIPNDGMGVIRALTGLGQRGREIDSDC